MRCLFLPEKTYDHFTLKSDASRAGLRTNRLHHNLYDLLSACKVTTYFGHFQIFLYKYVS